MKVLNFPIGVSELNWSRQRCINYDLSVSITCCECWLPPDTLLAVIRAQPRQRVTCSDNIRPLRSSAVNNIPNSWFYQHWKLSDWSDSRQNWQLTTANNAKLLQVDKAFLRFYHSYNFLSKLSELWKVLDRKFWWWMWHTVCVCGKVAIFPNPSNQIRLVDKSQGLSGAHERYVGSGDEIRTECNVSHFSSEFVPT